MTVFEEDLLYLSDELKKNELYNKVFFVTGATGLVGSVLVKAILFGNQRYNLNNRVIAFVRNKEKAEHIFGGYDGLEFCIGDILEPIAYDGQIDFIIHSACETKSVRMVNSPVETLWTSLNGSKNVLDFAVTKKIEKLVYLSSMEAFGNLGNMKERVSENQLGYIDIQSVRSCYPESKRMVENMCVCYASEYNVPVVVARLAQTFGAGVSIEENRVFAQFARNALNGKDIVLHTTGESYGNYVYTADAISAIFILLKKGTVSEVYTVANEKSNMRIIDMAKMVAEKISGGNISVVIDMSNASSYGYAPNVILKLDASKICKLGWTPKIDLEESYRRLMRDWEEQK